MPEPLSPQKQKRPEAIFASGLFFCDEKMI